MYKYITAIVFASGLGIAACGGDSPCDELKDQCSSCPDVARQSCEAAVDLTQQLGGDDACQAQLDNGGVGC